MALIKTNSPVDDMLDGGFEGDILNTIYGGSATGKTNFCMMAAVETAKQGKKVLYLDTEGGFSAERLKQICPDYQDITSKIFFLRPTSFSEQKKAFQKLKEAVNDGVGLIIVDSIAMLYRVELGKGEEVYEANRELGQQISYLAEIARKKAIPVLLTTQVYSSFDQQNSLKMVGGDMLKNWSKCIIRLDKYHDGLRSALLEKHRSIPEGRKLFFKITEQGIEKFEKP